MALTLLPGQLFSLSAALYPGEAGYGAAFSPAPEASGFNERQLSNEKR